MGKKSKLKTIRKIAKQLPEIMVNKVLGTPVGGEELYKRGIGEVDGKLVLPGRMYRETKTVAVPFNHEKKMKRMYNKFGAEGVGTYVSNIKQTAKVIEQNKKIADEREA